MLQKVLLWLSKVAIGKQLLGLVNGINERLTGRRSEILIAIQCLLFLLKKFGVLPPELLTASDALSAAILGALPVTLVEKLSNAQSIADQVIPTPVLPVNPPAAP